MQIVSLRFRLSFILPILAAIALATSVRGAFISYLGVPLAEDFDSLGAAGLTTSATNGGNGGWYVAAIGARTYTPGDPNNALPADGRTGPFQTAYPPPPEADVLTDSSDGLSAPNTGNPRGGLYNYGTDGSTDRALGVIASGSIPVGTLNPQMASQAAAMEVAIINDSGTQLIGFDMSFLAEHWHAAQGPGSTPVRAYYSLDGGTIWTELPEEFSLIEIDSINYTNNNLDGNTVQMGRGGVFMFPGGETLGDGGEFYVRWVDINDGGITDMGVAIDNWSFEGIPVPEPGLGSLGLAGLSLVLRRRRQKPL